MPVTQQMTQTLHYHEKIKCLVQFLVWIIRQDISPESVRMELTYESNETHKQ